MVTTPVGMSASDAGPALPEPALDGPAGRATVDDDAPRGAVVMEDPADPGGRSRAPAPQGRRSLFRR